MKRIFCKLIKGLALFGRFDHREKRLLIFVQVALGHSGIDLIKKGTVLSLQIDQEFFDCLDKQSNMRPRRRMLD